MSDGSADDDDYPMDGEDDNDDDDDDDDDDDEEEEDEEEEDDDNNEQQQERRTRGAAKSTRQSISTKQSFACARRRFDLFCSSHLNKSDMDYLEEEIVGEVICESRPWTYNSLIKERIPYKLMDYYADYLCKHAKKLKGGGASLSYSTAMRYFSAIKEDIAVSLSEEGKSNAALNREAIARIYAGMQRTFKQAAYDESRNMVNPRKPLKLDDILTTAICCIWDGTYRYAAFFCYFLSLMQLAGRATEIAKVPWRNMELITPPEWEGQRESRIAEITLWRSKSYHMQGLSIFPHRNSFLQDWYFGMAYAMLLEPNTPSKEYMFRLFASKSDEAEAAFDEQNNNNDNPKKLQSKKESVKNKAVSQLYNNFLRDLVAQSVNLAPDPEPNADEPPVRVAAGHVRNFKIPNDIHSHSNKKWAVNTGDEVFSLKTTWVCFRVGWAMEAAHTIFDYLVSNRKSDQQVGKALSGWTHQDPNGRLGGGYPPRMHAVRGHEHDDLADKFVRSLFWRYDDDTWEPDLKYLLTATILMHLNDFIKLLLEHPQQKFGSTAPDAWDRHNFLQVIHTAAIDVGIDEARVLLEWGALIKKDFVQRNVAFVQLQQVHDLNPDGADVVDDERCLMSGITAMADRVAENVIVTRELKDDWDDKSRNLVTQEQLQEALRIHGQRVATAVAKQVAKEVRKECRRAIADAIAKAIVGRQAQTPATTAPANAATNNDSVENTSQEEDDDDDDNDDDDCYINRNKNPVAATPRLRSQQRQASQSPSTKIPTYYLRGGGGLKDFTLDGYFLQWHVNDHHTLIYRKSVDRALRSTAIFAIEYFTLFLSNHPRPRPTGACRGDAATKVWKRELEALVAEGAGRVKALLAKHEKPYQKISTFKTLMYQIGPAEWPQGPQGQSHFQPIKVTAKGVTVECPLRTRQQLVDHYTKTQNRKKRNSGKVQHNNNQEEKDDDDLEA